MKKMSLSRKIKLAFVRISKYEALFWIYPFLWYFTLFIDDSKDMNLANGIGSTVGIAASVLYLFVLSNFFTNIKQFKTFPMAFKDMIDVLIYEIIIRAVAMAAGNSALIVVGLSPRAVPYIICMFFAMAAVASLMIPFYMTTYSLRVLKPADDSKRNRVDIFKGISIIVIYIVLQAVISTIMFRFAFASERLANDIGILAAVFAVSIAILVLITKICGKKKFWIEC